MAIDRIITMAHSDVSPRCKMFVFEVHASVDSITCLDSMLIVEKNLLAVVLSNLRTNTATVTE